MDDKGAPAGPCEESRIRSLIKVFTIIVGFILLAIFIWLCWQYATLLPEPIETVEWWGW